MGRQVKGIARVDISVESTGGTQQPRQVAVVGGGISGLAAAHRLGELDPSIEVTLFEASARLGGVLETVVEQGFLLERSADNFLTNLPWAVDLCRRIGFEDQLLDTNDANRRALVVHRGQLIPVPEGFVLLAPQRVWPVLKSPLLSWRGKLRLALERFVRPRRDGVDESLAEFACRRLGREAFERIVQPLVGGIYTADPEKLSVAATMPRFVEMERKYGSLTRGIKQSSRDPSSHTGARYSMFVAPQGGMSSLVRAIADRLPEGCVRLDAPVEHVARLDDGRWRLRYARGEYRQSEVHNFDAIVLALPAPRAGRLLEEVDSELSAELGGIQYASSAVVTLAYRRDQIRREIDGFGFVVPASENRRILAGSFSSVKFSGRAPDGSVSIRVFIGGAMQSELLAKSDDELEQLARGELGELIGTSGEPLFSSVTRWNNAMPQYHVGHTDRVGRVKDRVSQLAGLALAGNAYEGVGVPNCIHSGEQAAQSVVEAICPG
jgi:oxygen-dependent protoporphyrinogen oxidase